MGIPQFILRLWGFGLILNYPGHCWNAVCSAWLRSPSLRLLPLPQPQIISPIHLGAGNLHTAQEVMDDSSKPVCLRLAQLSISVGCETHLSFHLLAGGRPACALHPRSSKAPLQATCGWLSGQPSELVPPLVFLVLPSPESMDLSHLLLLQSYCTDRPAAEVF